MNSNMSAGINISEHNFEDIDVDFSVKVEDDSMHKSDTDSPIPNKDSFNTQNEINIYEDSILDFLSNAYAENMHTLETLNARYPDDDELTSTNSSHCLEKMNITFQNESPESKSKHQNNVKILSQMSKTVKDHQQLTKGIKVSVTSGASKLVSDNPKQTHLFKNKKPEISSTLNKISSGRINNQLCLSNKTNPKTSVPVQKSVLHNDNFLEESNYLRVGQSSDSSASQNNNMQTQTSKYRKMEVPWLSTSWVPSPSNLPTPQINASSMETSKPVNVRVSPQSSISTEQITEQSLTKYGNVGKPSLSSTPTSQTYVNLTQAPKLVNVGFSQASISSVKVTQTAVPQYVSVGKSFLPCTATLLSNITQNVTPKLANVGVFPPSSISLVKITQQTLVPKYVSIGKSFMPFTSTSLSNLTQNVTPKLANVGVLPQSSISAVKINKQTPVPKHVSVGKSSPPCTSTSLSNVTQTVPSKLANVGVLPQSSISAVKINEQTPVPKHVSVGKSSLPCTSTSLSNVTQTVPPKLANVGVLPQSTISAVQNNEQTGKCPPLVSQLMIQKKAEHEVTVAMKNVKNTLKVGDAVSQIKSEKIIDSPEKLSEKYKKKLQMMKKIKIKKEIIKVARVKTKKIKFGTLCKLKELDRKDVLLWLMDMRLIHSQYSCHECPENMKLTKSRDINSGSNYVWQCCSPKNIKSVYLGSIFQNSKDNIEDILMLIHCWIYKVPQEWIYSELPFNKKTATLWEKICRDSCTEIIARDGSMIGGFGKVVEIEGKVFEKNMNKNIISKYIFVGLEDAYTEKYFFRIVENGNKESFLQTVKSAVLPDTTIVSHFYPDLLFEDLIDPSEYSSYKFECFNNTSSKKKSWEFILRQLPNHLKTNYTFDNYIGEFVWRKKNSAANDKMRKFISDLKLIYPLTQKTKAG